MDMGGTGGILVASHLVGREMRRIVDEPERRHEIEDGLRDLYEALTVTTNPIPIKAALNMAGVRGRRAAPAAGRGHRRGEGSRSRGARAPRAARRGVSSPRHAPRPAARRARRDRQEHDGRRVRRPDRRRRHRADVPDAGPARHRPRPARLRLPARARRRHRGDRAHPRARGPRRRAAVRAARARPHAAHLRRPAHRGDGPLQARRAPLQRRADRGRPGEPELRGRAVLGGDGQDGPLDPRLVRGRAHLRAGHHARHRRLQVRPDPGGRRARRRRAGSPSSAARGCCCCAATRPTPTGPGVSLSESSVGPKLEEVFARCSGRIVVTCFASNIHRVQQVVDAAALLGRKVSLVGRSMRKNVNIGRMLGHIDVPEGMLVGPKEIEDFPDQKLVVISTGSQGEPLSALRRMAHGDHPQVELHDGDTVIFSATPIPGNERAVNETINRIYRLGADVITAADVPVHASGHGYAEELKLMLNLTKPALRDARARRPPAAAPARRAGRGGRRRRPSRSSAARTACRSRSTRRGARFGDARAGRDDLRRRRGRRATSRTWPCATAACCPPTASSSWSRRSPSRTAARSRRPRSSSAACRSSTRPTASSRSCATAVDESLARSAEEEIREIDLLQDHLHDDVAEFVYDRLRRRPMVLPVVVEV